MFKLAGFEEDINCRADVERAKGSATDPRRTPLTSSNALRERACGLTQSPPLPAKAQTRQRANLPSHSSIMLGVLIKVYMSYSLNSENLP